MAYDSVKRRERYWKNPEKARKQSRDWAQKHRNSAKNKEYRNRSKYGLEPEDYNYLLTRQSYKCAICFEREGELGVDHNHVTGEVRGLLCDSCNNGIGRFKDDIKILASAIKYLDR